MSTLLRFKCPKCGKVQDVPGNGPCRKCGIMINLPEDGVIQVYRMGNLMGMAVRMKIYLNDIQLGYLGNTESIRIPVPYGHYKIYLQMPEKGLSRCFVTPLEFDITPAYRYAFFKAHIVPGAWNSTVRVEPATPDQMPPLEMT